MYTSQSQDAQPTREPSRGRGVVHLARVAVAVASAVVGLGRVRVALLLGAGVLTLHCRLEGVDERGKKRRRRQTRRHNLAPWLGRFIGVEARALRVFIARQ